MHDSMLVLVHHRQDGETLQFALLAGFRLLDALSNSRDSAFCIESFSAVVPEGANHCALATVDLTVRCGDRGGYRIGGNQWELARSSDTRRLAEERDRKYRHTDPVCPV